MVKPGSISVLSFEKNELKQTCGLIKTYFGQNVDLSKEKFTKKLI